MNLWVTLFQFVISVVKKDKIKLVSMLASFLPKEWAIAKLFNFLGNIRFLMVFIALKWLFNGLKAIAVFVIKKILLWRHNKLKTK